VIIEEDFVSDRGRRRRRSIRVDLDAVRRSLDLPSAEDLSVWRRIRTELQRRVGESTFDIWLDPIELIAADSERQLMLAAPARTAA
jgi:DnaA N-terminal domain